MSTPTQWEQSKREKALKLTPIGREKLKNSILHRVDSRTIILKPKK